MKCVACGSTALVEGTLMDKSSGGTSTFNPNELPIWKSMFGVGTREVRAYGCIKCQHLQLAVGFSEKDFQRYRQFEGEQPSVLERINPERGEVGK
jgi:prolyl-tRNA synthetase